MRYSIGIDPGLSTGFAVWDREQGKFLEVRTLDFWRAIDEVARRFTPDDAEIVLDATAISKGVWATGKRVDPNSLGVMKQISRGVGKNAAHAELLLERLRSLGFTVTPVKAHSVKVKGPAYFAYVTGWRGRCSQHARDSAMLVYGR